MSEEFYCEQQGEVMIYGFTRSNDDDVDVWASALDAYLQNLPSSKAFSILMDVSDKSVSFTPRARQRTVELFTRFRAHRGRFAFLFSSRVAPYYSRIFFASLGRLAFELNYFTDKQKALDWLNQ